MAGALGSSALPSHLSGSVPGPGPVCRCAFRCRVLSHPAAGHVRLCAQARRSSFKTTSQNMNPFCVPSPMYSPIIECQRVSMPNSKWLTRFQDTESERMSLHCRSIHYVRTRAHARTKNARGFMRAKIHQNRQHQPTRSAETNRLTGDGP